MTDTSSNNAAIHPRNIRMVIEYDGTNYVGWQFQINGVSVQETLETALAAALEHSVRVLAAGRTDAGVHAKGQVVNFFTNSHLPTRAILVQTLRRLPEDIAIVSVDDVSSDFNARCNATLRWYKFFLLNRSIRPTAGRQYLTHVYGKLDFDAMEQVCDLLAGVHDFRAFRSINCQAVRTLLTMRRPRIQRFPDGLITVDYMARSFLQNMVRIMTGCLVSVGRGRMAPAEVARMMEDYHRPVEAVTLPPQGLFLYRVYYGDEPPEGTYPDDSGHPLFPLAQS
ncbi:MAG: tRNA pseudouridine(38-40) synthase TruA [Candidatus Sumerlaeales bacterium]|nr:tRNA pseudouridine(38-40) synthase TruA [Candidatus Sumerlaeales bacterium]